MRLVGRGGLRSLLAAMKAAHYPGLPVPTPVAARLRRGLLVPGLAVLLALGGCGGNDKIRRAASPPPVQRTWPQVRPADPIAANAVLMRAIGLVGTPYRYGGNTPDSGFDCSGLVTYVYREMLDLRLPRTSRELAQVQGPRIAPEKLAAADLVFFGSRGNVTHVGIYVGEGRFVHAPSTGGTVRLDHLDGYYWRDHYSGAKRVLN
ncbi:MAG TPA: C40 family peptidase [Pseudoxanthomonas sp.]